ncbi:hypothetical protein [Pseudomonas sp. HY7a-MNA-CIBAN-0227]|uniref:hypothetical protein n=1 Tax=Pseudomonas sp. HY7a-MNA-CIBAN-0227 TaxID=3140474 RepID=UPI00332E1820
MPILIKSVLRSALIATALLQVSGCASNGFLVPQKDFIVNNSRLSVDDVFDVLKFSGATCRINKQDGHGFGDGKITNISESCIAAKYPTCSHWYDQNLDIACVMAIAKPAYDEDLTAKASMKRADAFAQQKADQANKERARQLQVQYEQSPQGIADKERTVSEGNETRAMCNKVVDKYAKINMFEVMSRNEYRKISE